MQPEFRRYAAAVVENARTLARILQDAGLRIVSAGTDTHLMLVDLRSAKVDGKTAERALDEVGITANRNAIPYDPAPPNNPSGLRLGTAAVTTRGFGRPEVEELGRIIARVLFAPHDEAVRVEAGNAVHELSGGFPVPGIAAG
jgi:glycine hydroxymethyltransferase